MRKTTMRHVPSATFVPGCDQGRNVVYEHSNRSTTTQETITLKVTMFF